MVNEISEVFNKKGVYNPETNPQGATFQTILEYMNENHPEQEVQYNGEPAGLGFVIDLPGTIHEERFILEAISGTGEAYNSDGLAKQLTIYVWDGKLLNELGQENPTEHISAPVSFIATPPLAPLPFKVKPAPDVDAFRVAILPTINVEDTPIFPLHFGAVTYKTINVNLIHLTFSIDDKENKMGELVVAIKATYRPITEYQLSGF